MCSKPNWQRELNNWAHFSPTQRLNWCLSKAECLALPAAPLTLSSGYLFGGNLRGRSQEVHWYAYCIGLFKSCWIIVICIVSMIDYSWIIACNSTQQILQYTYPYCDYVQLVYTLWDTINPGCSVYPVIDHALARRHSEGPQMFGPGPTSSIRSIHVMFA